MNFSSLRIASFEHDFIIADVGSAEVAKAKEIRERRDKLYGNIYREVASDQRWVGDLGELCFSCWLSLRKVSFTWLDADAAAAGNKDFVVGDTSVGVKTVKRKSGVKSDYTAQITEHHAEEPVDAFFFLSYEYPRNRMWLLGGCTKAFFLNNAKRYGPGEQVHANYTVREKHAILNLPIKLLHQPEDWLSTPF
jgi:hypothetical protein